MDREPGRIGRGSSPGHGEVQGLDDVAPNRQIAQCVLNARPEDPAGDPGRLGQPQAFELHGAPDHQPPELWIDLGAAGAKVDAAVTLVGERPQAAVELRPSIGFDVAFEGSGDFALAARTELERHTGFGPGA